mgnify:FL=1
MTVLSLSLWIAAAVCLQLALWLSISFWRHWQEYRQLRWHTRDQSIAPLPAQPSVAAIGSAAWNGYRSFRVARKEFEDGLHSVASFYLVPEDGKPLPPFLPGQFLTFQLPRDNSNPIVRCYSLSAAPHADYYRVSIKRVPAPPDSSLPPGLGSSYFHDQVAVGSKLQVRAPSGHFHIDQGHAPVVLIGGGIGITPMLSMLYWLLAQQPQREVWLFYGVRNSQELVMAPQLRQLAAQHPQFHLQLCFSNPLPGDQPGRDFQHQGRVDIQLLRLLLPLKPFHYYICGPGPMMQSMVAALEDWGVSDSQIHYEAFGPASIKRRGVAQPETAAAEPVATGEAILINFARSGKQLAWQASAGSLLDFAEANGIVVDSGCRAGGCGSCQTTIRSGEVTYRQTPDFDPEPGNCLLCVCTPKTSLTLEA